MGVRWLKHPFRQPPVEADFSWPRTFQLTSPDSKILSFELDGAERSMRDRITPHGIRGLRAVQLPRSLTGQQRSWKSYTKRPLKSIALALPLAVLVIGAVDNVDLPGPLQHFLSLLDITGYFSTWVAFTWQPHLFERWAIPINTAFYAAVLFAFLSWQAHRPRPRLSGARSLVGSARLASFTVDDPNIPALATVRDPDEWGQLLEPLWGSGWKDALREVQVRPLKWHRAKRCTCEIDLRTDIVGKVYANDRADVYEVMQGLRDAGFGREAEFSIPQPIAYLPSLRLLLQEKVEGPTATEIFLNGDSWQRERTAERCARWLARFHAVAPRVGRVSDVGTILSTCERRREFIAKQAGRLATQSQQLLERLRVRASSLGTIPRCCTHGDFSPGQVILTEGRTVTVDWDACRIADPTRDVATFLVRLGQLGLKRLGSIRALDGPAEVFLTTYLASGGHSQVAVHLAFYKAARCLAEARGEVKTKKRRWRKWAEVMLDEGLRILEQHKDAVPFLGASTGSSL